MILAEELREKALQLKQDFDDVKAAGYREGVSASGGGDTDAAYNEGFDAGKQAQYDLFWDSLQDNGNRTHYGFAFSAEMWTAETFKPKYPIRGTNMQNAFAYWGQNSARTELIDLRQFEIDFSKATIIANAFYRSYQILAIGEIDTRSASNINGMFQDARNLETIEKIILKDDGSTGLTNTFTNARKLTNVVWEGVIGQNLMFYTNCPLTHESLMNTINHLKCFRYDAGNHFVLNSLPQDIDDTYTIATATPYEHPQMGGLQCIAITFSDADFTVDFYATDNEDVKTITKAGNKMEIKFNSETGLEKCIVYDKEATTTHTLSIGVQNLAKLTDAEKAIATEKGWTLT